MPLPTFHLGGFDLTDHSGLIYGCSVIAEGTSRGKPVPLNVAVKSWLQDGSIVVTQGYDNREVTLRVRFRAPNLTALAVAESALFAEMGKPNLLTWSPGNGPASVFVVVTSEFESAPAPSEDIAEQGAYPFRSYNLTLTCEAFVRSVSEVTAPALPTGTTTTLLDDCSSASGWSGFVAGASSTVTNASGTNRVSGSGLKELRKTFAATTSVTNLLVVDYEVLTLTAEPLVAIGDGAVLTRVATQPSPTVAGNLRSYFRVAAPTLGVTKFQWDGGMAGTILRITNVAVADAPPSFGTTRQRARTVEVEGSARTAARLVLESETTSLGDVLLYVRTVSGADPSLRQYRFSGAGAVPDASRVSGFYEPLSTAAQFFIPKAFVPAATYLLIGRLASSSGTTAGTITATASTVVGSTFLGSQAKTSVPLSLGTGYTNVVLCRLQLPTIDTPDNSTASVSLSITQTISAGAVFRFDELWLFDVSAGRLINVSCGSGAAASGGPARRLFVLPPDVVTPRPRILMGHAADMSDAFAPGAALAGWQFPQFEPPETSLYWVTSNATDATGAIHFFPTWHTHAGL